MAITSKYFILTPSGNNLDFIDFGLNYGSVTTVGESVQVNGSSQVDSVFVRPGLTYDLTSTGGGVDKIYFTGNLSDYSLAFDSASQILTLKRNLGTSTQEIVTVAGGSAFNYDNLVFANGTVPTNTLSLAVQNSTALPLPSSSETSLNPTGAAMPGAALNATIQAYSTNPAGINQVGETFASVKPGINYVINGGSGIDTVYVANGEHVDATVTGSSVDLIYFRGKWADYTKDRLSNDTVLQFTRTIDGHLEYVTVTAGTAFNPDKLIFADGAVTTDNALIGIKISPTIPLINVPGVDPLTVTPLYSNEEVANALATIARAAEMDTAISSGLDIPVFTVAGVTGVTSANRASIDSALDSAAVKGTNADTTSKVQDIVNAYNAILASANGTVGDTSPAITGQQYSNIGVTGVSGLAAPGNALFLLDNVVDGSQPAAVDTEPEVQALVNAANHVIDAAGGTAAQAAALTLADLTALGITGVTPDNLPAIVAAIAATVPDTSVDTKGELQDVVNAAATNATNAVNAIRDAAQGDSAISSGLGIPVFTAAGVSGVTAANLVSIDLALDSRAVTGAQADTTGKVQGIVNAYNAILASANGVPDDTIPQLTGAQYMAIGVTNVSGFAAPGNPMNLLDSAVDGSPRAGVDTVVEVQAMADAANHVIAAAGGTPAQIAALTLADLTALGITGVTAGNLPAVQVAVGAVPSDASVDTVHELQDIVNMGIANAATALGLIAVAAQGNTAISSGLDIPVFVAAGVTGVTVANRGSIDSALDSLPIKGIDADTTSEVQTIVNAYSAILASADGTLGNTIPALTGTQFSAVGVTGVAGFAAPGNAMFLLDNVVDGSLVPAVDTVPELQAMANAALHVISGAAGGTAPTVADLTALGITGVDAGNIAAVQAAIAATPDDGTGVDTKAELQNIVTAVGAGSTNALNQIRDAAQNNTAVHDGLAASVFVTAGVTGVTAANQGSIDTALDSDAIKGINADSVTKVQDIVNAYNAILASANGTVGDTSPAITGQQYSNIGVTGVSGLAAPGNALFLLDNVVDGSQPAAVDTEPEVQALANAANHVIDAAGGTAAQAAALTLADLTALGITGVTPDNLPAVLAAIQATAPDTAIDTKSELQNVVSGAATAAFNALGIIAHAAEFNTAISSGLGLPTFTAAGVSGVTVGNLTSIDSALDSQPVKGTDADTTAEVQHIVDAYNAILASADGVQENTSPALTSTPYTLVGVTGVSGISAPGNVLHLLDSAVDASLVPAVDTVPELQAMADAAAHVLTGAAGGTAPTLADLTALGITGVNAGNLAAVQLAIAATPDDGTAVDTYGELQALITAAGISATNALNQIRDAAQNNTAVHDGLAASVFVTAGVTGVTAANQGSIDTALDSDAIKGINADSVTKVQDIVNAYNAILASANGTVGDTSPAITGQQYSNIGVTGVSGLAAPGNALFLLDNVVDGSQPAAVDTEPEVQALANAANHVIDAAGGTAAQAAALTLADLTALGITGVTPDNLPAVLAAIQATAPDTAIDTKSELQNVVSGAATAAFNALGIIAHAAEFNTAISSGLGLPTFTAAGVSGVTVGNLGSIDSALDSQPVKGTDADTTAEVQHIVDAYNAILASADGVQENTSPALTSTPYTLVGVTGVSGISAPGNVLHLLDSAVDASLVPAVDTVPELQAMADAAAHVLTGAAGGTAPTLADLTALGITGVNAGNLAPVLAAIAATPDDGTAVDTYGELQALVTTTINSHPTITGGALASVTNLDVTSDLVLNSTQSLTVGTGFIHITDLGGPGYQDDPMTTGDGHTNTQTIDVATAVANHLLSIVGTGSNTHIVINPMWDLDLSSNYQLTIDDGAFRNADGSQAAAHIAPINFSTVIPGTHVAGTVATEAHASQMMVDSTGGLTAGKSWMDIQGIGNNTSPVVQLGDLSGGAYALVMKNYATAPGGTINTGDGIATHDTNVGVTNFGVNDIVYFDGQANDGSQFYDPRYTSVANGGNVGGLPGQNALIMGLVATPQQGGSTANILLGLEGNSAGTIYPSVVSLPDGTVGWSNVWHGGTSGVVMG